jgi:hypothetical protein
MLTQNSRRNPSNSNDMRGQFLRMLNFVVAVAAGIDSYHADADILFGTDLAQCKKAPATRTLPQPPGL